MPTPDFLRALIELAACETLDQLLDDTHALLERGLGVRARIELWDDDDTQHVRGDALYTTSPHRTWIGQQFTLGTIHVSAPPVDATALALVACQLAPLAERLLEQEASQHRTLREDLARVYDRRIRDALMRNDWNASAVARALHVGRTRVAEVAQRWRARHQRIYRPIAAVVVANADQRDKASSHASQLLHAAPRSL